EGAEELSLVDQPAPQCQQGQDQISRNVGKHTAGHGAGSRPEDSGIAGGSRATRPLGKRLRDRLTDHKPARRAEEAVSFGTEVELRTQTDSGGWLPQVSPAVGPLPGPLVLVSQSTQPRRAWPVSIQ